jgi:hypothetical protein
MYGLLKYLKANLVNATNYTVYPTTNSYSMTALIEWEYKIKLIFTY